MIILAEITPYNPGLPGELTVRFSSGARLPVFNGQHWSSRLLDGLSLGMSIFEDGFETAGSSRTSGRVQISIGDGERDELTSYSWDRRQIKIWTGDSDDFNDFTLRFDGFVSGVAFNEKTLDLSLGDKSNVFDQPIDFPVYAGTGGNEGPADMTDIVKPFCFGPIFNMEPSLVDATNQIYQVHNRACQAIDDVFDQAVVLTSDGDTTDIGAWTAVPGKYKTDISKGLFKLGAKPAGLVTADIQGDNVGGYVTTAGDILQRLLDFIPDSSAITVDAAAFTALNVANSSTVSIHGRAAMNARDLFNVLLRSVGGYWLVDWFGNLTVGIHDINVPAATVTDRHISSLLRMDSPAPLWRLKTAYRPTWRVQTGSEVAAAELGGTWRSGSGLPASNLGIIDDLYLNKDNGKVYEKTAISTWTFQYDLTGAAGNDGTAGADGDIWHDGTGVPAGGLGTVGDYYLNNSNGDYYEKTGASAWTLRGNIKGDPGAAGNDGAAGATGATGNTGADGDSLTTEYSINGSTLWHSAFTGGDIYMRQRLGAGAWSAAIKLVGDDGATGATGSTGATGNTGAAGADGNWTDMKFIASDTQPATPTGDNPGGYSNTIPANGTRWQVVATKTSAGTLVGSWSTPELYSGVYRGVHSSVATYNLGDSVTHGGRAFILTVTSSTNNTPPITNTSDAFWDLLSAKGDGGDPPSAFNDSATHSSGAVLNMRTLANTLGYDGVSDATFTVTVSTSITALSGAAANTGAWPAGKVINLTLIVNSGVVLQGAGGDGGNGGSTGASGGSGGGGRHGAVMLESLSITNNGTISGGSGGGGGGGWPNGGGGTGGAGGNGAGGNGGNATISGGGSSGSSGGGSAGSGGSGGGKSGISPLNGNNGIAGSNSGGAGGIKGDGIKKNGHTLTLSGSGANSGIGT